MAFNLGNFAGQLQPGEINGALKNVGSDYQIPEVPETQLQMPQSAGPSVAADPPPPPAPVDDVGGGVSGFDAVKGVAKDTLSDAPLKGIINLQTIGTLVGSYFGGPAGGQIGGALGGMAKNNNDKQKQGGGLR